jgi:hypothetical protein
MSHLLRYIYFLHMVEFWLTLRSSNLVNEHLHIRPLKSRSETWPIKETSLNIVKNITFRSKQKALNKCFALFSFDYLYTSQAHETLKINASGFWILWENESCVFANKLLYPYWKLIVTGTSPNNRPPSANTQSNPPPLSVNNGLD